MRFKTAVNLGLIAALSLAITACATRRPAGPGATTGPAANAEGGYTTGPGPVTSSSNGVLPGTMQDFVVNVGDTVFFDTDSFTLRNDAYPILENQSRWLASYPQVRIRIEGNADERGTREYNIALSARRATATRNFLIAQGVKASRISSIAFGKEKPAELCDTEECWSQNRRSVTVITGGAKTS